MNKTLVTNREGAKEQNKSRSYYRYKKYEDAIAKASDNGRLWWIEQYLKNTLKY